MPCYHPRDAILRYHSDTKKYTVEFANLAGATSQSFKPMKRHPYDRLVKVPCKKCIGCRLVKADDWAKRVQLEALYHPNMNYFITLTYDDDHLMISDEDHQRVSYVNAFDEETGVIDDDAFVNVPSLCKQDLKDFIDGLRYYCPPGLKFFGCGEYGPKNLRPHFHVIIFGLKLPDIDDCSFFNNVKVEADGSSYFLPQALTPDLSQCAPGSPYFISKFLSKHWKFGFHTLFPYSYNTGRYIAKYLVKGTNLNVSYPGLVDFRTPEFLHMSRRPGIARMFFDEHREQLERFGNVAISTENGAITTPMPEYFYRLIKNYGVDVKRGIEYVPESFIKWFELKTRNAYRGELYIDSLCRNNGISPRLYLERAEEVALAASAAKKRLDF